MLRNFRLNPTIAALAALWAVLVFTAPAAPAQVKPFKVTGGGTAPEGLPLFNGGPPASHNATGTATHLGKYSGDEGMFTLLSFDFETLTGTFGGSFVFVAANGDRLKCNYRRNSEIPGTGTFFVSGFTEDGEIIVTFIQEFTPVPSESTGKFAQVTGGSFIMIATTDPFPLEIIDGYTQPFSYTWKGEGKLEFAK